MNLNEEKPLNKIIASIPRPSLDEVKENISIKSSFDSMKPKPKELTPEERICREYTYSHKSIFYWLDLGDRLSKLVGSTNDLVSTPIKIDLDSNGHENSKTDKIEEFGGSSLIVSWVIIILIIIYFFW